MLIILYTMNKFDVMPYEPRTRTVTVTGMTDYWEVAKLLMLEQSSSVYDEKHSHSPSCDLQMPLLEHSLT